MTAPRSAKPPGEAEGRSGKDARLLDVAKLAGVSRATAARTLGGYGSVSEETQKRVSQAAAALNYRTNVLARAMRAGRSLTIGLVIADISNTFFDRATRAIIDTAAESGYQVLVINTDDDLGAEMQAVRVLLEKRVDGLIVVPSSRDRYDHLISEGTFVAPLVLLDRRIPELHTGTVSTDDHTGAIAAVRLFVDRGHRRIGLLVATAAAAEPTGVRPAAAVSTVSDRVGGFIAGLGEAGLDFDPDWVRYTNVDHASSREAATQILATDNRPTAILATNVDMTLAVIAACRDLNLSIGEDVSLIGFDDSPWARVFSPPISVVERPVYELGRTAVVNLLAQIDGKQVRSESVELETVLIDRESVATLPR
jgi:LacI family transcriptional regulator